MLFNSYIFLFCFLPIVVLGIAVIQRNQYPSPYVLVWLLVVSLVFYTYWRPLYLLLLLSSIGINYLLGLQLSRYPKRSTLWVALTFNLGLLAYFKYDLFFLSWFGVQTETPSVLPLAISFFTFQQISFLVDTYKGETDEPSLIRYGLFVSFFPQLIAGPIVRHKEIKHQLSSIAFDRENITFGSVTFIIGLGKKLLIADQLAPLTNHFFFLSSPHDFLSAWLAALCFGFEIYFDFSAYTDMAIGVARIFGIKFPENFNSPYQSTSIIEFWRRWHITLSFFLRDYLYIPLGGNRKGTPRKMFNLLATMILGGLWHGANWTFVIWGMLHGIFLIINHGWRYIQKIMPIRVPQQISFSLSWALTFTSSISAFVIFKADSIQTALNIWKGMFFMNGLAIPTPERYKPLFEVLDTIGISYVFAPPSLQMITASLLVAICIGIIWFPNTAQLARKITYGMRPASYSFYLAIVSALCLIFLNEQSPFIYFVF